jgi:hypothetical protein
LRVLFADIQNHRVNPLFIDNIARFIVGCEAVIIFVPRLAAMAASEEGNGNSMKSAVRHAMGLAVGAIAFALPFAAPAIGQKPSLAMLDQLDKGSWELRFRDDGNLQRLCLTDWRRLIQLRHPTATCERVIVDDQASQVTVQYTCRGHGYGRTHIRRETSRLVQIDGQGIADGLPFAFAAEARRVGDCAG